MTRAKRSGGNKKIANSLVALSSAAVLGVYTAGFVRTRAAAQRFAEADQRRAPAHVPAPAPIAPPVATIEAPAVVPPVATPPAPKDAAIKKQVASGFSRKDAAVAAPLPAVPSQNPAKPQPAAAAAGLPPEGGSHPPVSAAPSVEKTPEAAPALSATADAPATSAPATPAPAAATGPATPPAVQYKDGTYSGWGTSRHGDIEATVIIANGRIASASISQCYTRYPCSWIVALPPQVAQRQSPEVDYVSGATQSTNAFYYAVVEALKKAK